MRVKSPICALVLTGAFALSIGFAQMARSGDPPTLEDQIEDAIVLGLGWLANQQKGDGGWGEIGWCNRVARTGLAVLKFEARAIEQGMDPLDPNYEYSATVQAGLQYLIANAYALRIGVEPAGDPDGNGNGYGVYLTDSVCGHEIYNTGIAMMAIAASNHPEMPVVAPPPIGAPDPYTLGDLLQDALDYMAWAQADPGCGLHRGGWRYGADECNSDNSNSGYATLGMAFAAVAPPWGFGLTIPQFVKDELDIWIDVIQDDVTGDTDDGGSWYDPAWAWVNILKTGNLIFEMALVGDELGTQRVQDAIDYIERHWYDAGGCDTGWTNHRQAMFAMMKGLEVYGIDLIDLIDLDGDNVPEHDWFAEVAQHLVDTQDPAGWWPNDCWGDQVLSTTWALLTLEKFVPQVRIEVPLDIKPTSCPNPINTKSQGALPVAILGMEDLDVTMIDPVSLLLVLDPTADPLVGVPPLRWAYEDVATPYEGELEDCLSCTTEGPDGHIDLTLKFDEQSVVELFVDEVEDGDCLILTVVGNLLEVAGGTPVRGEDVVRIVKKKSKK